MALLVAEGFDDLSNSGFSTHMLNKVYAWSGAYISAFSNAGTRVDGRYGGYGKGSGNTGSTDLVWTLPSAISEIYVAFAVIRRADFASGQSILRLRDGSSTQIAVRMGAGDPSVLEVYRNATLLGSYASFFPLSVWRWLSIRVVINNTVGIVEVRDGNGNVLLNLTGIDTQETANATANNVWLGATQNASIALDDVFVMDNAGSTFNGHLSERAIRTVFPTANGATVSWSNNGAATAWECVDEQTPDDDTTYIASATPGAVNLSALGNLTGTESGIDGVVVQHRSRKDDAGARSMRGLLRTNGSNYSGETVSLDSSYAHVADLWELNPDSSLGWSRAAVDALESGVEVVS